MINRYAHLIDLVRDHEPATIVEVGTWDGRRAIEMARAALSRRAVAYTGFDLFEDATAETDARELNVKRHVRLADVRAKLSEFQARNHGFGFRLVKGDSRTTLTDMAADFAFIDGGHSVETIASDYQRLKRSDVVVLDDFYLPDAEGRIPDITRFGCNRLLDRLRTETRRRIQILPAADRVRGGGLVSMVAITRG